MVVVGGMILTGCYRRLPPTDIYLYSFTHGEFQIELPEPELGEITAFSKGAY